LNLLFNFHPLIGHHILFSKKIYSKNKISLFFSVFKTQVDDPLLISLKKGTWGRERKIYQRMRYLKKKFFKYVFIIISQMNNFQFLQYMNILIKNSWIFIILFYWNKVWIEIFGPTFWIGKKKEQGQMQEENESEKCCSSNVAAHLLLLDKGGITIKGQWLFLTTYILKKTPNFWAKLM